MNIKKENNVIYIYESNIVDLKELRSPVKASIFLEHNNECNFPLNVPEIIKGFLVINGDSVKIDLSNTIIKSHFQSNSPIKIEHFPKNVMGEIECIIDLGNGKTTDMIHDMKDFRRYIRGLK